MKKSYLTALVALALIALWVASGYLFPSGTPADGRSAKGSVQEGDKPFRVRVADIAAVDFTQELTLRGHTQASRKVAVKAEVDGRVVDTPVEKGASVAKGAALCVLESRARDQELAEARARLEQRRIEYEAAKALAAAGHRSRTGLAQAKAALAAAQAEVRRKELALANTRIRAPFDGVVVDRPVEIGDYLGVGGVCAEVAALDPLLVIASVPEAAVAHVAVGKSVRLRFLDGGTAQGRIRFVAPAADPATRTFRIEIALANPNGRLRDGLTATAILPLKTVKAHRIPPSVLVLGPEGRIGVRAVDEQGVVRFHPVTILQDAGRAIWVGGLPARLRLITVGQDFVRAGETVEAVPDRDVARLVGQEDGAARKRQSSAAALSQDGGENAS